MNEADLGNRKVDVSSPVAIKGRFVFIVNIMDDGVH